MLGGFLLIRQSKTAVYNLLIIHHVVGISLAGANTPTRITKFQSVKETKAIFSYWCHVEKEL